MNNRAKGVRERTKTKKWLEAQGYIVDVSEVNKICFFNNRTMAVHRDLFGSDLIAMDGKDIIFIQCKSNSDKFQGAKREFESYPFPPQVKKWVVWWEPRAKQPIIKSI